MSTDDHRPGHPGDPPTDDPFAEPGIREVVHGTRNLGDANARLRQAVGRHLGLPVTDVIALTHLQVHGSMSQRELAEGLGVSPSAVTIMLDRLEPLGLMTRVPDPHDRRRTMVHVYSPQADPLGIYAAIARPFLRLSEDDRRHALRLLPLLREIVNASAAEIDALPPAAATRAARAAKSARSAGSAGPAGSTGTVPVEG